MCVVCAGAQHAIPKRILLQARMQAQTKLAHVPYSDMDLNTPPQTHTHTQCAFVWTEMKEVHSERSNQQLKVKVCSKLAVLSELKRWAAIESIDPRMSAIGAMMS